MTGIVHADDGEWTEDGHGAAYALRRKFLARAAGLKQIGASLYELPPGKRNWPLHFHHANDEAFWFVSGTGLMRVGGAEHAVGPGTFVGCSRGDAAGAHQVMNTGSEPLRFLCVSGMQEPDVTEYPEQDKIGVFCGGAPGTPAEMRTVNETHRRSGAVSYWDAGEA